MAAVDGIVLAGTAGFAIIIIATVLVIIGVHQEERRSTLTDRLPFQRCSPAASWAVTCGLRPGPLRNGTAHEHSPPAEPGGRCARLPRPRTSRPPGASSSPADGRIAKCRPAHVGPHLRWPRSDSHVHDLCKQVLVALPTD
jgi:hypothetical protein